MKLLYLLLFVLTISSCSIIQVTCDLDKTVDFTKFKSYAYTPEALRLGILELDRTG